MGIADKTAGGPVDFEIMPGKGIFPFMLGMSLFDLLLVMKGWRVGKISFDEDMDKIDATLISKRKSIDVTISARWKGDMDYRIIEVGSDYALARNGKEIKSISNKELKKMYGINLRKYDKDTVAEDIRIEYFSNEDRTFKIFRDSYIEDYVIINNIK